MDGDGGAFDRYMDACRDWAEDEGLVDPVTHEERLQNVEKWFERLTELNRSKEDECVNWFMNGDVKGHR